MTDSDRTPPSPDAAVPAGEFPPLTERVLRLGTRRSALATTQSGWVADLLRARGLQVEIVEVVTEGDVNHAPLTQIGGTGVFASALRHALRAGEVDLAVHSLKDLPVLPEPGLVIAAVPVREDPRDVLVARDGLTLAQLPAGARVGTGSPRRAAQLAVHRPDLVVEPIRGNVDSRVRRVTSGELDAVVLAGAGLRRLGRDAEITDVVDTAIMLPAPGQGALAVECRESDTDLVEALGALEHDPTRIAITAERALLRALEAGCTAPVGAYARVEDDGGLVLEAFAGSDDATIALRRRATGAAETPADVGVALATELLADGADRIPASMLARTPSRTRPQHEGDHPDSPNDMGAPKEQTP
ncbi:hydroxymethylbilane synthase [Mobilicoccus pelagius]|uniref:Porphobilinogen deaminase n=1 Tax=Mobilicoccus pelagius NBRC 104925 TaxID=1089455 RepID=H5US29_9MICO|nr:porphobilinogen deaminase [Mobilicoccus pelagius NBRC 104925]